MTLKTAELIAQLAAIREQLHTGRFGQREAWERSLAETEAALGAQTGVAPEIAELIEQLRSLAMLLTEAETKSEAGFDQWCLDAANALAALAQEVERLRADNETMDSRFREICDRGNSNRMKADASEQRAETAEARVREMGSLCAFFADQGTYSDSYGVQGSDFGCCRFCEAGGAPHIKFEHDPKCPVLKAERFAEQWQNEHDEELKEYETELAAIEAVTIERCAKVADTTDIGRVRSPAIAAAIRALAKEPAT